MACATSASASSTAFRGASTKPVWISFQRARRSTSSFSGSNGVDDSAGSELGPPEAGCEAFARSAVDIRCSLSATISWCGSAMVLLLDHRPLRIAVGFVDQVVEQGAEVDHRRAQI